MVEKLRSITKSTYINEGLRVLEVIKENNYESFKKLMKEVDINQNSDYSRETCWGQIKKRYIDFKNEDEILYSPMLKLFNNNIILKKELMYLNYVYIETTFRKLLLELIYPKLKNANDVILSRDQIADFLDQYLSYSSATLEKTARSSAKALIDFGMAEGDGNNIIITYYQPELKTFLYALYNEYSKENSKYNNFNILNPSVDHIVNKAEFHKILLINPNFIKSFLQSGWKAGYLSYEPRGGLNQYVLKYKNIKGFADYIKNEEV